jgi:hypothetical protein
MSSFPNTVPYGSLLFDNAIKLASVNVTVAVLSESGEAWYTSGKMAPELARAGEATLKSSAALTTTSSQPLNVLAYSTEGNIRPEGSSITQPYYAGYTPSLLSLQIVRNGIAFRSLAGAPPTPNVPGLRADTYSGLDAIFSPKSKSTFQVGLYLVGNTYVGIAADWALNVSDATPGNAIYVVTFFTAPEVKQIPGQPHPLKPGEAVERRTAQGLKAEGLKNKLD